MNRFLSFTIFISSLFIFCLCDEVKLSDIKKKNPNSDTTLDESNKNKLYVYIIESKIISKQLVGSTPDINFEHNYMLRSSLTFVKSNNLDSLITDETFKDSTQTKNILLEYFTGHKCGNCPVASKPVFEAIENTYGKKVNVVKIHASTFANPSSTYPNDFRTETGNELLATFGINNLPIGMIDRIDYQGASRLLSPTDWIAKIQGELNVPATFGIWESHSFDGNALQITTKIKVKNLNTKKLYALSFDGKVKPEWILQNCNLVFFLIDAKGNVLQSVKKSFQ